MRIVVGGTLPARAWSTLLETAFTASSRTLAIVPVARRSRCSLSVCRTRTVGLRPLSSLTIGVIGLTGLVALLTARSIRRRPGRIALLTASTLHRTWPVATLARLAGGAVVSTVAIVTVVRTAVYRTGDTRSHRTSASCRTCVAVSLAIVGGSTIAIPATALIVGEFLSPAFVFGTHKI